MPNGFTADATPFDPYERPTEPQVATAFPLDREIEGCGPGRIEREEAVQYQGKIYRIIARDKILAEDWLSSQTKATAYALRRVETYRGTPPARAFRDALIRTDLEV